MANNTKNVNVEELEQKFSVLIEKVNSLADAISVQHKRTDQVADKIDRLNVKMDYTPTRFSSTPIKTSARALEDILFQSGQMSRENWETLRGVVYDFDGEEENVLVSFSESDEEFTQSEYASYANKPAPRVVETPKITSSEQIVAKVDDPASAESATGGQATSDPKKDS